MDTTGFIMLFGGVWGLSLIPVEYLLIKKRRYVWAAIYTLPIIWFVGGYVASSG